MEIREDFFAKSWKYQDSYVRNNVNLNLKIDYAVYGMKFLSRVFIPRALIDEYQNHVNWWISESCQLMNIRIMSIDEYWYHVNWWISESCQLMNSRIISIDEYQDLDIISHTHHLSEVLLLISTIFLLQRLCCQCVLFGSHHSISQICCENHHQFFTKRYV